MPVDGVKLRHIRIVNILSVIVFILITQADSASGFDLSISPTDLKFELTSKYNDNILRYSPRDIDRFLNRTEYYTSKLTTYDDWNNDFRVKFYFRGPKLFEYPLRFKYFGKFSHFMRNPLKNYGNHTLLISQRVSKALEFDFRYFYMPYYYLREYCDRDFNSPQSCYFSDHKARIGFDYKLNNMTRITLRTQYEQIYFNQYFTEYDSEIWSYEAEIYHKFTWDFRIIIYGGFALSNNVGFSNSRLIGESSEFLEDAEYGDSSYREELYQTEIRYRIRNLLKEDTWFSLQYKLRHRIYTTDNSLANDPFHAGRLDDRHRIVFSIRRPITAKIDVALSYTREWRRTQSDYQTVIDIKNFDQNVMGISLTYTVF